MCRLKMRAVQLSTDHNTSIEEEVFTIRAEHPDDNQVIFNDRVKGRLKLTRAFGAGFWIEEGDGGDIHSALAEWTGLRTVPNVFIGGKHIGGCDTVLEKHTAYQLIPLLNEAGRSPITLLNSE